MPKYDWSALGEQPSQHDWSALDEPTPEQQGPPIPTSVRAAQHLEQMKSQPETPSFAAGVMAQGNKLEPQQAPDAGWEGSAHANKPLGRYIWDAAKGAFIDTATMAPNLIAGAYFGPGGMALTGAGTEIARQKLEGEPLNLEKAGWQGVYQGGIQAAPAAALQGGVRALAGPNLPEADAALNQAKSQGIDLTYPEASGYGQGLQRYVGRKSISGSPIAQRRAANVTKQIENATDDVLGQVHPSEVSAEDVGANVLSARDKISGGLQQNFEDLKGATNARYDAQAAALEAAREEGRREAAAKITKILDEISPAKGAEEVGAQTIGSIKQGERAAGQIGGNLFEEARAKPSEQVDSTALTRASAAVEKELTSGLGGAPRAGKLPADADAILKDTNRGGTGIDPKLENQIRTQMGGLPGEPGEAKATEWIQKNYPQLAKGGQSKPMTQQEAKYLYTTLDDLSRNGSPEAQRIAARLQPVLRDSIDASLTPEGQAALDEARKYWAKKSEFFDESRPGLVSKSLKGTVEPADVTRVATGSPQSTRDVLTATEEYAGHPQTANAFRRRVAEETILPPSKAGELADVNASMAKLTDRLRAGGPILDILSEGSAATRGAVAKVGEVASAQEAASQATEHGLAGLKAKKPLELRELQKTHQENLANAPLANLRGNEPAKVPTSLRSSAKLTNEALRVLGPTEKAELRRRVLQEIINPPSAQGGTHEAPDLTGISERMARHKPVLDALAKEDPGTKIAINNLRDVASTAEKVEEAKPGIFKSGEFWKTRMIGGLLRMAGGGVVGAAVGHPLAGAGAELLAERQLAKMVYSPSATAKFVSAMKTASNPAFQRGISQTIREVPMAYPFNKPEKKLDVYQPRQ